MISLVYLLLAIGFLCAAHLIRVSRWSLFVSVYEKPNTKSLIFSLTIGYFLNYILPFKLGDIVRAYLSGKKMKNGKTLGFSTVIVDRYLDVICVGIIFFLFSKTGIESESSKNLAKLFIAIALIFIIIMWIVYLFRGPVKKLVHSFAGIFNANIESKIFRLSWALIWNFKDILHKINKLKLIGISALMWVTYIISYLFLAKALNVIGIGMIWTDVFMMLFSQEGLQKSTNTTILSWHSLIFVAYMTISLVILLLISLFMKDREISTGKNNYLNLFPHLHPDERLNFLDNYFSNNNREHVKTYLEINRSVSIIKDFSAGSNATTMLCTDGTSTVYRKYAFGSDAEKLYQQILWIKQNEKNLPLPQILKEEKSNRYCFYDMQYNPNTVGLFTYVHSTPFDKAWNMMERILNCLEGSIYKENVRASSPDIIRKYILQKVNKNLQKIKKANRFKDLIKYDKIIINGVEFPNIGQYMKYLSVDYLENVFLDDYYSVIHGDLTIENIICTYDGSGHDNFYIIDPNTGNIHDSPNLDYGKLLQSIHGGYEFLMATKDVKVCGNHIDFLFTRSAVYVKLHEKFKDLMEEKFGRKVTKSIYFHEIIHWLRLMPYKIEKDEKRAVLFYAGLLMVMNDVIKTYGEDI